MNRSDEIALIDLSIIVRRHYAVSGKEPDPDFCSNESIKKIHELTQHHPHAAICLDVPPYLKRERVPSYKADRPVQEAALYHQMRLAREALAKEGYPVWGVRGYEADDVIATATKRALASDPEMKVLIISADKDLLQLVGPRVRALSTATGVVADETAVIERFGVPPSQMCDWLCLVGDTSDNIKGAQKIGPKGATLLLNTFLTVEDIFKAMDVPDAQMQMKPAMLASLQEFRGRYAEVKSLITLNAELEFPFEEIAAERPVPQLAEVPAAITMDESPMRPSTAQAFEDVGSPANYPDAPINLPLPDASIKNASALAVRIPEVLQAWERQLDPRDMLQARVLAQDMFASRLFGGFNNEPACLAAICMGRELGMSAIASLRGINVIEGRPSLSAGLMVALVLRSGLAEYFEPVSMSDTSCTFVTKRKSSRSEVSLTHTIEMAVTAGLVKPNSNWIKVPTDMLVARCQSRLARLIYPDLLAGLYSAEEVEEFSRAA